MLGTRRANMREFWNTIVQQMKPKFHEISAFLIALAFCWMLAFHPEFRQGYIVFLTGNWSLSPYFITLGLIMTVGLILSLFHVFVQRKKSAIEKFLIGWFVLGTSIIASFVSGGEMLEARSSVVLIFPVWNIIMSVVLLAQMGAQKYEIMDDNASFVDTIITTVILIGLLLVSDSFLHLSWSVTLSVCIFFSTSIVFITTWAIHRLRRRVSMIRRNKS
jgi:hypothetical protein